MKHKMLFLLLILITGSLGFVKGQSTTGRSKVVVSPYTVKIYNITGTGGQGTEVTSNASITANTVYYVTVTTSTSGIATLLARSADGFETGLWSGGFVPYADPTSAQGDGTTFAFRIRTFSGFDFFTPLYMRVLQCTSNCANPGGTGWGTNKVILFPQP